MQIAAIPYINIEGAVYCNMELLVEVGIKYRTIEFGYTTKADHWQSIKDPSDNRRRLIAFAPMKPKYKRMVVAKYGDPYEQVNIQFFEERLIYLEEDRQAIEDFRTSKGEQLSQGKREAYIKSAALLAYLDSLPRLSKSYLKNLGYANSKTYYKAVHTYIKRTQLPLPASTRIFTKLTDYREHGAIAVIHGGHSNTNSQIITTEAKSILVRLMSDDKGRKFTRKEVWRQFKYLAKQYKLGSKMVNISYPTLLFHIRATEHLWFAARHGSKEFMLSREIRINKNKPSQPHLQWQIDGTPAPLWYYCAKSKQLRKLYTVVIIDTYSDAIIGYAIGETETMNMVFTALKMAIKVQGCKPFELRSDKGSANIGGETRALLANLGIRLNTSKAGNPKARSIEGQQGAWMKNVLTYFENKSGMNITTKTLDSRQNPEIVRQNYKEYPNKEEVIEQIQLSIASYNNWSIEGKRRRSERLQDAAPDARKVSLYEIMDYFFIFRKRGKKYQKYYFTTEGITMQVGNKEYKYLPNTADAMELAKFANKHTNRTTFYIKYDPSDLGQIGLYVLPANAPEESAEHFRLVAWATTKGKSNEMLQFASEEERENYKYLRQVKQEQQNHVAEELEDQAQYLDAINILQKGIDIQDVRKDDLNAAKQELQRLQVLGYGKTTLNQDQEQYLEPIKLPTEEEEEEPKDIYDGDFDITTLLEL